MNAYREVRRLLEEYDAVRSYPLNTDTYILCSSLFGGNLPSHEFILKMWDMSTVDTAVGGKDCLQVIVFGRTTNAESLSRSVGEFRVNFEGTHVDLFENAKEEEKGKVAFRSFIEDDTHPSLSVLVGIESITMFFKGVLGILKRTGNLCNEKMSESLIRTLSVIHNWMNATSPMMSMGVYTIEVSDDICNALKLFLDDNHAIWGEEEANLLAQIQTIHVKRNLVMEYG